MNRQLASKAQQPKNSALLSAADILQRKVINKTGFNTPFVDTGSPSEHLINKHNPPGTGTHFSQDFNKIPASLNSPYSPYSTQSKLKTGQSNDKSRQEVNQMEKQVRRMPNTNLQSIFTGERRTFGYESSRHAPEPVGLNFRNNPITLSVHKKIRPFVASKHSAIQRKRVNACDEGCLQHMEAKPMDRTAPQGVAVQLYSDPTPPPELDETQLPVANPSGEPVPDTGAAVASIEEGVGLVADSETTSTTQESEDDNVIQTSAQTGMSGAAPTHSVQSIVARLSSGGQPLSANIQQRLGAFLGRDFSSVRVHTDARTGTLANSLHAQAFTVGNQIAFGPGHYQPETTKGQRLLTHELTHVCQQADGLEGNILASGIGSPGDRYEQEAEANAEKYLRNVQRAYVRQTKPATTNNSEKAGTLQLYSGSAAAAYARTWALGTNPSFPRMANDCTNFVSQAMDAGGWTMLTGSGYCADRKKNSVWWYRRNGCSYWWRSNVHASHTWGGAENFYRFTNSSGRGTIASRVSDLDIGDVLQMAFSGTHVGHTMIVTDKRDGNLYLSYHTSDHLDEPFWGSGGILSRYTSANYYAWKL